MARCSQPNLDLSENSEWFLFNRMISSSGYHTHARDRACKMPRSLTFSSQISIRGSFLPFYSCNICCSKQLSGRKLNNTNFLWLIAAILGPLLTSLQARWSSAKWLGILIPLHGTAVHSEHRSTLQIQLIKVAVLWAMQDPADSEIRTRRKLLAGSRNLKKGSEMQVSDH